MSEIAVHRDALPIPIFRRLLHAVQEIGTERLNESYTTNFWFRLDARPCNLVEEIIPQLCVLARPGPRCIGVEWWLGRLRYGQSLALHFDRDMALEQQTGQVVHPLWSSILYLNRYPSSPTVILDQVLDRDRGSLLPPVARNGKAIYPLPNQYVVYRGDLHHGVVASRAPRQLHGRSRKAVSPSEMRLTLLVNYWDRRPLPPVCRDYDGAVYGALRQAHAPKVDDVAAAF
jgi:hypothetical protein